MDNNIDSKEWVKIMLVFLIRLVLMIIAGYLSLDCNKNSNIIIRILFMFFSAIFSEVYILYYTIYRIIMGNSCPL